VSGCAQRSIGSNGMALQRGVLMPEWRSMGTWQRVVERSSVVNGLRPGSLEEIIYLSAAQEEYRLAISLFNYLLIPVVRSDHDPLLTQAGLLLF